MLSSLNSFIAFRSDLNPFSGKMNCESFCCCCFLFYFYVVISTWMYLWFVFYYCCLTFKLSSHQIPIVFYSTAKKQKKLLAFSHRLIWILWAHCRYGNDWTWIFFFRRYRSTVVNSFVCNSMQMLLQQQQQQQKQNNRIKWWYIKVTNELKLNKNCSNNFFLFASEMWRSSSNLMIASFYGKLPMNFTL